MPYSHNFFLQFRKSPLYIFFVIFFLLNSVLSAFFSIGIVGQWNMYTNISQSMEPTIHKGDLAVVKRQNMNSYDVGDIVTYYAEINGNPEIVTHRIHQIGGNVYITKGDNNPAPDPEYLRPRLIIGKVVAIIPYLGSWVMILKSLLGRLLFIIIPMFLIVTCEMQFLRMSRKK